MVWASSPVRVKENLQKLVFPSGISYDVKKEAFRTEEVNELFSLNASLNALSEDDIKENGGIEATVSNLVGWTGFEPATPCTPYKCATGLRHHPNSGAANVKEKYFLRREFEKKTAFPYSILDNAIYFQLGIISVSSSFSQNKKIQRRH